MKIERTKNATRNIIFGVLLKLQQILIPFVMRTAMIQLMGVQYLGLNSLFTSILQVLNLAELGVGSAMVYGMYKPIVDDDQQKICALMKLYRTYYRFIGLIIAVVGGALTPFVPLLIKSDVPEGISVYVLYLLHLGATVLSYWLFAYKNALFQAHQRTDISSRVSIVTSLIQFFVQIFLLWLFRNYYLYVLISLLVQAINNIVIAIIATKKYPRYKAEGKLSDEEIKVINKRVRDLFTSKVGAVIVNSSDSIVISAFLGLTILAIYQNYYFILVSIIGFVAVAFSACTAGIGNSIIVETKEKNFGDLKKFTFLICWISTFCACSFLNLYQPFMTIWVGEDLMLKYSAVICFVIYFYVFEINQLLNTYKDAGGLWHEDRFRPLITAITNLTLNLIMVQFMGIYGVLLSTVISMIMVGMPWLLTNLFTTVFDKKYLKPYLKKLLEYTVVAILISVLSVLICKNVVWGEIGTLVIRLVICILLPNIAFICLYRNKTEYIQVVDLIDKMTGRRFKLSK